MFLLTFHRSYIVVSKLLRDPTGITTCCICIKVLGASIDVVEDYR